MRVPSATRAEHREARREIEGHGLFFYREAGTRLRMR